MKKIILALVTCIVFYNTSFAWGREGHTIVAQMAYRLLSPKAQEAVLKAVGGVSIAEAGPWMDGLRDQHQYDFMKPWHYINIPKGQDYHPTNEEDIATHLIRVIRELQHKDVLCADQVKMDLLVLFHLMGDIHQPLHTGYGEDKGGNGAQVTWMGAGTNLHSVWDSKIIEREKITLETIEAAYRNNKSFIMYEDVKGWLRESREALTQVYGFTGNFLDEKYSSANRELVIRQLLKASVRLAYVLETAFGGATFDGIPLDGGIGIAPSAVPTMKPEDAARHIGKVVTVCGLVYGVKETERVNYINMGAAYPNSPVTIVIFQDAKATFKTKLKAYDNGRICVTGIVKEYKGKTEIIVSKEEQISVKQ